MSGDVQPEEPPAALLDAARQVAPAWLRRITTQALVVGGFDPADATPALDRMVDAASADLLARLGELLATDVDRQRTTPLSLFREAVTAATTFLREHDVPAPGPDPGAAGAVDDVYRLGPATWSDIDPTLHEPGLRWGAWKAMTVLARRRDEGLR